MSKKLIAGVMAAAMAVVSVGWSFGDKIALFDTNNSHTASAYDSSDVANNWIFRELNNADSYSGRISGTTIFLDWDDPALRGIISKEIYSDYKMTAQIKKGSSSYWTSLQLGLPYDDRLDMWENINGSNLIGGTGLQVAISDTKAVVGLVNGVESYDVTQVEVQLNGINTTSDFVDIAVTVKDDVYDITIGSQHIATVTPDKGSIQYGSMEIRRESVNGVMTPVYADSDVAYYTSGKITANGYDTYFSNKAIAAVNTATGDGTFGFSTRAEDFWVRDVVVSDASDLVKNTIFTGQNTGSGWNQVVTVSTTRAGGSFDPATVKADGYFYVEYSGTQGELELIVQSWTGANNWGKVKPAETGSANGRYYAKFPYADCVSAFGSENFAGMLDRVYVGALHDSLTVYDLSYYAPDESEPEDPVTPEPPAVGSSTEGLAGTYYIKNIYSGKYLEVAGSSTDDGANIQQWSYTGAANQQFKLVSNNSGYYEILTGATNFTKAVDVDDWGTENGTNIHQWTYNGLNCQLFEIIKTGDYISIGTKVTSGAKMLDVEGPSTNDGANVHQWEKLNQTSQQWILESVTTSGGDTGDTTVAEGFYVDGTTLRDANGNAFVMRGVNIPHAWYTWETESAIASAAALGANTVRLVLSNGTKYTKTTASDLEQVLTWCKNNKVIAVLELHDATGSDDVNALNNAVNYWIEMKDILNANRKYAIVNIANEWYGQWNGSAWAEGYKSAIPALRNAGIMNTIMVDCAGYGQYPASIHDYGASVFNSDPQRNTVFSIHMYEYSGGMDPNNIRNNIDKSLALNVPLVIGEFGNRHSNGDVDENTIMSYCQEKSVGYLGWSWCGNSGGVEYLDIVNNWNASSLTEWGNILFNNANGIRNTSSICTVYTGSTGGSGGTGSGGSSEEEEILPVPPAVGSSVAGLDGEYYIKNVNSGKYLDVEGSSAENLANVYQWEYTGANNQKFKLESDGSGYYSIYTGSSSYTKSIDVDGWTAKDGANIIQWDYHGGDCQKFEIIQVGDAYAIKTKVSANQSALDVDAWGTENGSNVIQWNYHGGTCQLWYLEKVSTGGGTGGGTGGSSGGSESVSANGMLRISGNQIVNQYGEPYVLRGMSTHGISWFPEFVNESAFRSLRDDWGMNAIRLACYSQDGIYRGQTDIDLVMKGVDACIALDMYVIVDWHVLNENYPAASKENAKEFFRQIIAKYGDCPNIIYELCNEPCNGPTWANDIKPYCEELLPIIRNTCDNIIICGTGTWSQDVHDVIGNAINSHNIAYAVHFYANSHDQWLRDRITNARNNGLCVIISEFGTCDASGDGGFNADQSYVWLNFLEDNKISYFNWSLCNKAETASALQPGSSAYGGWTDSNLTDSGRLYFNWVKQH